MTTHSRASKIIIPLLIIAAGFWIMKALIYSRRAPEKIEEARHGILVRTITAHREKRPVIVNSNGAVRPVREISVAPRVSGSVIKVNPAFIAGGFLKKDEIMFEIDPEDYLIAREKAKAAVAKAEYDLAVVEGQARVARLAWERQKTTLNAHSAPISTSNDSPDPSRPSSLALYGPQTVNAKAALAAARAELREADLNLARTKIYTPFNCRVRSEQVDPGQYIKAGIEVAEIFGADEAEVLTPVRLSDLEWLTVPGGGEKGVGSRAFVTGLVNGRPHTWQGRIARSYGELDPKSRMVSLAISLPDPYRLNSTASPAAMDLYMGLFVDVSLQGDSLYEVFTLPRSALRDNNTIWLMDNDDYLRIRSVVPLSAGPDEVLIKEGINEGDRIVLTRLAGAADGMLLRTAEKPQP